MKNTMPFIQPVEDAKRVPVRRELYEQSVDLYEQGKHLEAFHCLLDYMNDGLRLKYGNDVGDEFHIPHGSIVVDIVIKDGIMLIEADFLKIPEKGRVAMLRQLADLNINKLMLARFLKDGDKLKIAYATPISQSHPHKIFGVLQNICSVGDRYDDEFCTKFGATRCYEPQVKPYSEEMLNRVYEGIQTIGKATLEALKEYNAVRAYGYSWNVLDTAFYQISYFAQPQGQLGNDLEKAVIDMDAERPVEEVVSKGTDYLKKLLGASKEELAKDLYSVDMLVSNRRSVSLQNVQEVFKSVYDESTAALQTSDFERVTVRLLYLFYETYFYNDVPADISAVIEYALRTSGGLPVEQAAKLLYKAIDDIMDGDLTSGIAASVDSDESGIAKNLMEQAAAAASAMQQKMADAMGGDDMVALQQKMTEAMSRGDMAEYARLAGEMQQKMMSNLFK